MWISNAPVVVHEVQREDKGMFLVDFLDVHHQSKKILRSNRTGVYPANDSFHRFCPLKMLLSGSQIVYATIQTFVQHKVTFTAGGIS